jgi:HEPN domain-containing protein
MSLEGWLRNGWLARHQASPREVAALLAAAADDLANAEKDLSAGWRFAIAYNAALRLSSVALSAAGYRAAREQKHYRSIAALPLLLGPEVRELAEFLDRCRTRRHEVTYELVSTVSQGEADELVNAVRELQSRVGAWLRANHPGLL